MLDIHTGNHHRIKLKSSENVLSNARNQGNPISKLFIFGHRKQPFNSQVGTLISCKYDGRTITTMHNKMAMQPANGPSSVSYSTVLMYNYTYMYVLESGNSNFKSIGNQPLHKAIAHHWFLPHLFSFTNSMQGSLHCASRGMPKTKGTTSTRI